MPIQQKAKQICTVSKNYVFRCQRCNKDHQRYVGKGQPFPKYCSRACRFSEESVNKDITSVIDEHRKYVRDLLKEYSEEQARGRAETYMRTKRFMFKVIVIQVVLYTIMAFRLGFIKYSWI